MADTNSVPFNVLPTDADMRTLFEEFRRQILLKLFCHGIATIQEFNPADQTAKASMVYPMTFFERQSDGTYQARTQNYPLLVDCPVVIMGGGAAHLTFPIQPGDTATVLFNDRDINAWLKSGQMNVPVGTNRLHAFSDAILLVGINSRANSIPGYDTQRAVLSNGPNGTTMVGVGPTLIKVANVTTTLGTIMTQLTVTLETLTAAMAGATPSTPWEIAVTAAAATAEGNLTAIATLIAGLLE